MQRGEGLAAAKADAEAPVSPGAVGDGQSPAITSHWAEHRATATQPPLPHRLRRASGPFSVDWAQKAAGTCPGGPAGSAGAGSLALWGPVSG